MSEVKAIDYINSEDIVNMKESIVNDDLNLDKMLDSAREQLTNLYGHCKDIVDEDTIKLGLSDSIRGRKLKNIVETEGINLGSEADKLASLGNMITLINRLHAIRLNKSVKDYGSVFGKVSSITSVAYTGQFIYGVVNNIKKGVYNDLSSDETKLKIVEDSLMVPTLAHNLVDLGKGLYDFRQLAKSYRDASEYFGNQGNVSFFDLDDIKSAKEIDVEGVEAGGKFSNTMAAVGIAIDGAWLGYDSYKLHKAKESGDDITDEALIVAGDVTCLVGDIASLFPPPFGPVIGGVMNTVGTVLKATGESIQGGSQGWEIASDVLESMVPLAPDGKSIDQAIQLKKASDNATNDGDKLILDRYHTIAALNATPLINKFAFAYAPVLEGKLYYEIKEKYGSFENFYTYIYNDRIKQMAKGQGNETFYNNMKKSLGVQTVRVIGATFDDMLGSHILNMIDKTSTDSMHRPYMNELYWFDDTKNHKVTNMHKDFSHGGGGSTIFQLSQDVDNVSGKMDAYTVVDFSSKYTSKFNINSVKLVDYNMVDNLVNFVVGNTQNRFNELLIDLGAGNDVIKLSKNVSSDNAVTQSIIKLLEGITGGSHTEEYKNQIYQMLHSLNIKERKIENRKEIVIDGNSGTDMASMAGLLELNADGTYDASEDSYKLNSIEYDLDSYQNAKYKIKNVETLELNKGSRNKIVATGENYESTIVKTILGGNRGNEIDFSNTKGVKLAYIGGKNKAGSVDRITGSNLSDYIVMSKTGSGKGGYKTGNYINGMGGNDMFVHQKGSTTYTQLNGGDGYDILDYRQAGGRIQVSIGENDVMRINEAPTGMGLVETYVGSSIEGVLGGKGNDFFTGNSKSNMFNGGLGRDEFLGYGGNDSFVGGEGIDTYDGGEGIDTVSYKDDKASVTVNLKTGKATTNDGEETLTSIENIIGSKYNDSILGDDGANRLEGGEGDDNLVGNGGNDVFVSGKGNDSYVGGDGIDTIDFSREQNEAYVDLEAGTANVDHIYEDGEKQENDTLSSIENVIGTRKIDFIKGSNEDNKIDGYKGNDHLEGRGGNDLLIGGEGNDCLDGGDGDDLLRGGEGRDEYIGGRGKDTVDFSQEYYGVNVDLSQNVASVKDRPVDKFHDPISHQERIIEVENIIGSRHDDTIKGDKNNNLLKGQDGNDNLYGQDGKDALFGDLGNDNLYGGAGNDRLEGGEGDDTLEGGAGDDTLEGGFGNDTYVFDRGFGKDTVINKAQKEIWYNKWHKLTDKGEDKIIFRNINSSEVEISVSADNKDVILKIKGTNDTLTLKDFIRGNIDKYDHYKSYVSIADGFVEKIQFADGAIWGKDEMYRKLYKIYNMKKYVDSTENSSIKNDEKYGHRVHIKSMDSGSGNYIAGTKGNDYIQIWDSSEDIIYANEGDDVIDAAINVKWKERPSSSEFHGGEGFDTITYENSDKAIHMIVRDGYIDIAKSDDKDSNSFGKFGVDKIYSIEKVIGSSGNDYLTGLDTDDILVGGDGDDNIYAGGGDDILEGGSGNNELTGGAGNNIYRFKGDWYEGSQKIWMTDRPETKNDRESIVLKNTSSRQIYFEKPGGSIVENGEMYIRIIGHSGKIKVHYKKDFDIYTSDNKKITTTQIKQMISQMETAFGNDCSVWENAIKNNDSIALSIINSIYEQSNVDINKYYGESYSKHTGIKELGIDNYLLKTENNATLTGTDKNDYLIAEGQNSKIYAGAGDDILESKGGILEGGVGNDKYFINGHGDIYDEGGDNDSIMTNFIESDTYYERENNDLVIKSRNSGEFMKIKGWFNGNKIETIYNIGSDKKITALGIENKLQQLDDFKSKCGMSIIDVMNSNLYELKNELDNILRSGYQQCNNQYDVDVEWQKNRLRFGVKSDYTIVGKEGQINIQGTNKNDYIEDSQGYDNSVIQAGEGDDIIVESSGNDTLYGGTGDDTYILNMWGRNTIEDSGSNKGDKIVLERNRSMVSTDLLYKRVDDDLYIFSGDRGDNLQYVYNYVSVKDWFKGDQYKIEEIHTADKKVITATQIDKLVEQMASFASNNNGLSFRNALTSTDDAGMLAREIIANAYQGKDEYLLA